jgi:hypothetical protein
VGLGAILYRRNTLPAQYLTPARRQAGTLLYLCTTVTVHSSTRYYCHGTTVAVHSSAVAVAVYTAVAVNTAVAVTVAVLLWLCIVVLWLWLYILLWLYCCGCTAVAVHSTTALVH